MNGYMQTGISVISIDVTYSPFLREARIDLNFGMAQNLSQELTSMAGLQQLPDFSTINSLLSNP